MADGRGPWPREPQSCTPHLCPHSRCHPPTHWACSSPGAARAQLSALAQPPRATSSSQAAAATCPERTKAGSAQARTLLPRRSSFSSERSSALSLRELGTVTQAQKKAQNCQGSPLLSRDPSSPRMNSQAGPVQSHRQSRGRNIAELQPQPVQSAPGRQPGCAGGHKHPQLLHLAQPSAPCTLSSSQ